MQGLTEFLPVSSSGHLVLAEALLGAGYDDGGSTVEVALHAGTLLAVCVFMRHDLKRLLRAAVTGTDASDPAMGRSMIACLLLATLPIAVVGLLFERDVDALFGRPWLAGIGFLCTGLVLLWARRLAPHGRLCDLEARSAATVGLFQILAMVPGLSRSGITIFGGMRAGLSPPEAGRFSFLLSIPVIAGAVVLKADAILGTPASQRGPLLVGVLAAFGSGLFALGLLSRLLRRQRIDAFAWYVIPLGVAVLALEALS